MARSYITYAFRCAGSIKDSLVQVMKRKTTLPEFGAECRSHARTFWSDCMRPPTTEDRKASVRLLNDGIRLYNKKQYMDALTAFKAAIEADSFYGRAHLYCGNAYYKLHHHEDALGAWERAVRLDPYSSSGLKAQAKLDRLKSQNQQAVKDIQEYLRK